MSVSGPAHVHLVGGPLCWSLIQLFISSRCLQLMQPQSWLNVCWHILAFGLDLQYLGIPNSDGVFIFVINFPMCCIKTMWLKVLWLSYSPLYMPFNKLWLLCFFLLCDIVCYAVGQWNPLVGKFFFVSFYWFVIKRRLKTTSNCLVLYKSALVTTNIAYLAQLWVSRNPASWGW